MYSHHSHDQFGLTKGIRIAEKMVILAIFWHVIWQPPMGLVAKKVEKMIKIFQIFLSDKKIIKRVQRPSFIKNIFTEPIFAQKLQDMKTLLPLKVAPTVGPFSEEVIFSCLAVFKRKSVLGGLF